MQFLGAASATGTRPHQLLHLGPRGARGDSVCGRGDGDGGGAVREEDGGRGGGAESEDRAPPPPTACTSTRASSSAWDWRAATAVREVLTSRSGLNVRIGGMLGLFDEKAVGFQFINPTFLFFLFFLSFFVLLFQILDTCCRFRQRVHISLFLFLAFVLEYREKWAGPKGQGAGGGVHRYLRFYPMYNTNRTCRLGANVGFESTEKVPGILGRNDKNFWLCDIADGITEMRRLGGLEI